MANPTDEAALNLKRDYVDCVRNLPMDLQRQITTMLECDAQQQMMISKMRELTSGSGRGKLDTDTLMKLLLSGRSLGDRKVEAAQHMSAMVEERGRRLAQSSAKYSGCAKASADGGSKAGGKEKTEGGDGSKERYLPSTSSSGTTAAAKEPSKLSTDRDGYESNNDVRMGKRPKRTRAEEPDYREIDEGAPAVQHSQTPLPRSTASVQTQSQGTLKKSVQKTETKIKKKVQIKKQPKDYSSSSDQKKYESFEMNEPTYCLCEQISYGEMICCDNDLCPIEWFHFVCVSLQSKPKGKWFCPRCRGDRPNTMKPMAEFMKELVRYNKEKEDKA